MGLLQWLLLPALLRSGTKLTREDFRVEIDRNQLFEIVKINGAASKHLDLSNSSISSIAGHAFNKVTDLTHLNLANNRINTLGGRTFERLKNLEYLSLANNGWRPGPVYPIYCPFENLRNLKVLDLSYNRDVAYLKRQQFGGLGGSCEVLTKGLPLREINAFMFKGPFHLGARPDSVYNPRDIAFDRQTGSLAVPQLPSIYIGGLKVKICIDNGIVKSLDVIAPRERLATGCSEVLVVPERWELHIRQFGITGFAKGWYRLKNHLIHNIDFSYNAIRRITQEILNDLPSSVGVVGLQGNLIERIDSGTMENPHLKALELRNNNISSVESGAFDKLSTIQNILLDINKLTDITFVATLPVSVQQLFLGNNSITRIPADVFSRLNGLFYLDLQSNRIEKLESRSLLGLTALEQLRLNNNSLTSIHPGVSPDLKALRVFDVSNNRITKLEPATFDGLKNIKAIDLRMNKLTELSKGSLAGLPNTLLYIWLDHNQIERLEEGAFKSAAPMRKITLNDNKIREIARGAFDLPNLRSLNLANNLLSEFNGDSFQGLSKLVQLNLSNNRIENVREAGKHLVGLGRELDLSNNLFTRLDNGSLAGIMVTPWLDIKVQNTPIEVIHSGVFGEP